MTYDVGLVNDSCLFDGGEFETLDEALEFASDRGGKYAVNIMCFGENHDLVGSAHLSADDTGKETKYSIEICGRWKPVSREEISKYV